VWASSRLGARAAWGRRGASGRRGRGPDAEVAGWGAVRDAAAQLAVPALRFQTRLLRARFSPNI
jgi:hypothetical protein